jgi:tetratricopeptide (TPR) repeat protein
MSRVYLTLLFSIGVFMCVFGQMNTKQLLKASIECSEKGDHYGALIYLEEAMEIDTNSIDVLWLMAESYRKYNDYQNAKALYTKVYKREEGFLYPDGLLYRGLMEKQCGDYKKALASFKLATKKYKSNRDSYNYLKAKNEIASCVWAMNEIESTDVEPIKIPEGINSKDADFGHTVVDDKLYFSSLRANKSSSNEEVYDTSYFNELYAADLSFQNNVRVKKIIELNSGKRHTGNGSMSSDGKRYYYSQCDEKKQVKTCVIKIANPQNGEFVYPDEIGEIINTPGTSNSMPHIAIVETQEVLFFSATRAGSKGGYDLYFSKIVDGNRYSPPINIDVLNTVENEISPFWDSASKRLYFSSTWGDGFGGFDIFYSQYEDGIFSEPRNAGLPLNSSANDNYYFQKDSNLYLSSNRLGVLYNKNPTCCSDIFGFKIKPEPIIPPTEEETLEKLMRRLPVTLFFHNDEPNPKSRDTVTQVNYINSYVEYRKLLPVYQKE